MILIIRCGARCSPTSFWTFTEILNELCVLSTGTVPFCRHQQDQVKDPRRDRCRQSVMRMSNGRFVLRRFVGWTPGTISQTTGCSWLCSKEQAWSDVDTCSVFGCARCLTAIVCGIHSWRVYAFSISCVVVDLDVTNSTKLLVLLCAEQLSASWCLQFKPLFVMVFLSTWCLFDGVMFHSLRSWRHTCSVPVCCWVCHGTHHDWIWYMFGSRPVKTLPLCVGFFGSNLLHGEQSHDPEGTANGEVEVHQKFRVHFGGRDHLHVFGVGRITLHGSVFSPLVLKCYCELLSHEICCSRSREQWKWHSAFPRVCWVLEEHLRQPQE